MATTTTTDCDRHVINSVAVTRSPVRGLLSLLLGSCTYSVNVLLREVHDVAWNSVLPGTLQLYNPRAPSVLLRCDAQVELSPLIAHFAPYIGYPPPSFATGNVNVPSIAPLAAGTLRGRSVLLNAIS